MSHRLEARGTGLSLHFVYLVFFDSKYIAFLQSGKNNLVQLASIHAGLMEEGFLKAIFEGYWTTAAAPTSKPMKPARIAADSTIPCGVFIRDSYSQKERGTLKKTPGRSPEGLGFKSLPERRQGKTVFLKIYPLTLKTNSEFVDARQRYASEEDIQLTFFLKYTSLFTPLLFVVNAILVVILCILSNTSASFPKVLHTLE